MKKIVLALLLLPVCALGVQTADCAAANRLVSLYQIRALMLRGASSYDIDKFIDAKLDELREPTPDGGFRWVRWARPTGSPSYDKQVHTVSAIQGSGADTFEASGSHVYAVRIAVPSKRSVFHGNNPVYIGTAHIRYTIDGRTRTKDEPVNNWMNPDTSRTIDLGGIADHVEASLDSSVNKSDVKEAVAEIHMLKAVAQDDPNNPNYDTITSLKQLRGSSDLDSIDDAIAQLNPDDTMPLIHIVRELRRADDLMRSKKQDDQEKGERLLKETLRRLR